MSNQTNQSATPAKDSVEAIERELMRLVHRFERKRARDESGEQTLERAGYLVLRCLHDGGAMRLGHVASELGLDTSTMSRQVHVLEAEGLVARIDDPEDGRACLLEVTDVGNERFAAARKRRRSVLRERLDHWSNDDKTKFAKLLSQYNNEMNDQ